MPRLLLTYVATLLCFLALDMIWLQGIAKSFYASELAGLLRPKPILWAAGLFYLVYPLGLMWFGILRAADPARASSVALSAALFGFCAYLTYDATNYAVMRNFPLSVAVADTLWGTAASAMACVAAWWLVGRLS